MLGLTMYANAQSSQCKIIGTTDGSTATVSIDGYDKSANKVTVGFYNDSEHVVTVIATVSADYGNCPTRIVATVQPRSSMSKMASWSCSVGAPKGIQIESAKCQPK